MDEQEIYYFEEEAYYPIKHKNLIGTYFLISESGKILNKKTNRLRKINDNGYFIYGNRKKINVGRLVGLTFMTGNENDFEILSKKNIKHIDGNCSNNHINNIQW